MHTPGSSRSDGRSLYDLFGRLCRASCDDERRLLLGAVLLHPEFQLKVATACAAVLKKLAERDDLHADLSQETTCLVAKRLLRARPGYHDAGACHFSGWIWTVIARATRRAWKHCRPIWLDHPALDGIDRPELLILCSDRRIDGDDVLTAISQIANPDMRHVLEDLSQDLTIEESVGSRGLSNWVVWNLRKRGIEHLQNVLFREE